MESIRLWLVIERENENAPWKFTAHSIEELEHWGLHAKETEETEEA